jgi:hypothetical protein
LLALPLLLGALVLGGYLLSWPLGHWPDLHPLEHPHPWAGRLTLFLMFGLVVYGTLRLFSGRVSACAWMVLAWAIVFVLGLFLAARMPSATFLALLPLAMFALGSVIDLFRKKSPAPLLMASILGFAAAAFISLYAFFALDVVMNFDRSHIKTATLFLMAATAMPMLLAFVRDRNLNWQPARWLLVAILTGCLIHLFLPGYTAERPRGMTLMYSEVEGAGQGHISLESAVGAPDRRYARSHGFEEQELNNGRLGSVTRPAREVPALGLPGVDARAMETTPEGEGWRRGLEFDLPPGQQLLQITMPEDAGLQRAWVNGLLALDLSIETKHRRKTTSLRLIHPPAGPLRIEFLTTSPDALATALVTWHELPGVLTAPFLGNWPDDAQPAFYGPRAEKIQTITLPGAP